MTAVAARVLACVFLVLAFNPVRIRAEGNVYLVVGSDTALWNFPNNAPGTVDAYHFSSYYPPDGLTATNRAGFQVMAPEFRNRFVDSYGQPLKLTWWVMGGSIFRYASNLNVPIPNIMPLHLMRQYHGEALRRFGDELTFHYHTFVWDDPNGDGIYHWNQARAFLECKDDFDFTLAQYLLEEEVFPVSFRAGWHFMDNSWQQYLDTLLPFSMHDDYGVSRIWSTNAEPIGGVENWSIAPSSFVPFHPATTNYQVPGDGRGWDVRSVKIQNLSTNHFQQIFSAAAAGTDQVACLWSHLPEDFLNQVIRADALAHLVASNFPTVKFRYCTAVEAMQRWLGTSDHTPPELAVSEHIDGYTLTLRLEADEPIWQPHPVVAFKDVWKQYFIVNCESVGKNAWTVTFPEPRDRITKVGIAITDLAGNLTTHIIRYLPDDIYLDNLDREYLELEGSWSSYTNSAWGVDARIALLGSNDIARAEWQIPISRPGRYEFAVQVPFVNGAASNLVFHLNVNGTNIQTEVLHTALPPYQWVSIGTWFLDQSSTNVLEMVASGTRLAGAVAVADVLRITAVPDATSPVILSTASSSDGFHFSFAALPGAQCRIERSLDLSIWDLLQTNVLPAYGVSAYTDHAPPPGRAFYRIALP